MTAPYHACSQPGVMRPVYFEGKLLTAEDLRAEQEYHIAKQRQLTRLLMGFGVVKGLSISCGGNSVTVAPGYAVDAIGRLIELHCACEFALPARQGIWDVEVELAEVPCEPAMPMDTPGAAETGPSFGRVQEIVKLWLVDRTDVPEKGDGSRDGSRRVNLGRIRAWDGQCEVAPRRGDVKPGTAGASA